MKEVAKYKKGRFTLVHKRGIDEWGFKSDFIAVYIDTFNGGRVYYPVIPPLKVSNYTGETEITDSTCDYDKKDYDQMIEEIKAIKTEEQWLTEIKPSITPHRANS